ncbi:hypothetical protein [Mycobacterium conspicuum]|nr:hypothetical protein [Mycobacterium conspicuum]
MKSPYMAAPLFAVAAMLAPAMAHADPQDDFVSRNGKAVCAALDKVQTGGDIFRLSLTIAHAGGFSLKDAASVIARSAIADCPWEEPKLRHAGNSAGGAATAPA